MKQLGLLVLEHHPALRAPDGPFTTLTLVVDAKSGQRRAQQLLFINSRYSHYLQEQN